VEGDRTPAAGHRAHRAAPAGSARWWLGPPRTVAWRWYLLLGLAAALLAGVLDGAWRGGALALVQLSCLAAGVLGLARHQPRPVSPWLLILSARGVWVAAAAVSYAGLGGLAGAQATIGVLFLLQYPLFALGAALLARSRLARSSWAGILDAAIFTATLTLLVWSFAVEPVARPQALATVQLAVMVAYGALDLLVVVVTARLLVVPALRTPANLLVAFAALGLALGDAALYRSAMATGTLHPSGVAEAVWLVSAVLLGTACLHPSVGRRERVEAGPDTVSRGRLRLSAGLALLAPAVPVLAGLARPAGAPPAWRDGLVAAVLVGAVSMLLVVRLGLIARSAHRRAVELDRQKAALHGQAKGLNEHAEALDVALQEHRRLQQDLAHRATHDPLTGLANRALLTQRLEDAVAASGRHRGMALMLLDLDGFKEVNDTLGHHAGDELLRIVAQRLSAVVPEGQTLARLGGDEFAVLLVNMRPAATAVSLGQRVLAALACPYPLAEREVTVTASVGIRYLARFRTESAADVMRHADIAMYAAKRSGKNRSSLYDPDASVAPDGSGHRFEAANL
jgi:diguanylate cyclase (GGDEF)-like protein